MITLKDFLELDASICGVELDIREPSGLLIEKHCFGVGAWAGNNRPMVSENVYREMTIYSREIFTYLHPQPINFYQSDEPYKGPCRLWGIMWKAFPKDILQLPIWRLSPFTASFRHTEQKGNYYHIDLIAGGPIEVSEIPKVEEELNDQMCMEDFIE